MKRTQSANARLNRLITEFGGLSRSCNDVRHCSRCGDSLTDPSSWERGIGPVCAKKDTHLFAKTIPTNFTMATMHAMSVKPELLPDNIAHIWSALRDVLFDKSEHAISASDSTGTFTFTFSGEDCRIIAKVIDCMLSFNVSPEMKHHLIQIVKHLGFVGLAGVLSGKSSTGEAEIKFEGGKLFLTGSSNRAGFNAMRVIPGIVIPRRRGQGAYEAPAAQHEKFIAAVMEFWPCFNGEIDAIVEQCKAWVAANPTAVKVQLANRPVATITNRTDDFVLTFGWDKTCTRRLVDEIKTIPSKDRSYDANTKAWAIKTAHKANIVALFSKHYEITELAGGATPPPVKKANPYARRPYFGSYYRGR